MQIPSGREGFVVLCLKGKYWRRDVMQPLNLPINLTMRIGFTASTGQIRHIHVKAFAEPVDIEPGALARLDIVFTTEEGEEAISPVTSGRIQTETIRGVTGVEGAWIATPISLSWPMVNNQNYLPPGEYQAKLEIVSEVGNLLVKDLKIRSPRRVEKLEIEI